MPKCSFPEMHHPPPVVFVTPWVFASSEIDTISTVGELRLHLKGGNVESPAHGAAGWFSGMFDILRKQVEKYTARDFIQKYLRFLSETSLRNVLLVEVDYAMVFSDTKNTSADDLDEATRTTQEYILKHPGEENKVVVSTLGRTNRGMMRDLDLLVETQYYRKHGFGKPGIEVRILGIPSVFVRHEGETQEDFENRLAATKILEKSSRRMLLAGEYSEAMKQLLADYSQHLRGLFDVERHEETVQAGQVAD